MYVQVNGSEAAATFAFPSRTAEAEREVRPTPFIDAARALDPDGTIQREAFTIASSRKETSRFEPSIDPLGAARLWWAAVKSGDKTQEGDKRRLRQNLQAEMRKLILEIVMPHSQVTYGRADIDQVNGQANIGGVPLVPMLAKGVHEKNPGWYNRLVEVNLAEALLAEKLFMHEGYRETHRLLSISPMPSDEEPRKKVLRKHGFRPDVGGGKWMIRLLGYEHGGFDCKWFLDTEDLSMGGSNIPVLRELFKELGVELPARPNLARRLGRKVLRTLGISRGFAEPAETTQMLTRSILVEKSALRSPVDVGCMADTIMAERRGGAYLCGIPTTTKPTEDDYLKVKLDSMERAKQIEKYTDRLVAAAENTVASDDLSFEEQSANFDAELVQVVRDLCEELPDYALYAFGPRAAALYKKAGILRMQNRHAEADKVIIVAYAVSTKVSFCGGTSSAPKTQINALLFPDQYLVKLYGTRGTRNGRCDMCGRKGLVGNCKPPAKAICGGCDYRRKTKY